MTTEEYLRKQDKKDRTARTASVFIVLITAIMIIYGLVQINTLITANQQSTIEARKANVARQESLQGYIKCILLLKYDYPNLNAQSTKAEVEQALDSCAKH